MQHNKRIISIHLDYMSINSELFICILDHYRFISGIFLLPFCSIFDKKVYYQTWAPSSTHDAFSFFSYFSVTFHLAWIFFISCSNSAVWTRSTYLRVSVYKTLFRPLLKVDLQNGPLSPEICTSVVFYWYFYLLEG